MISDVPLGAFLSGGIDSSLIVALASKHTKLLNTFSIGYANEPHFDETAYAELVAEKYKTNHTVFKLTNDDLFGAIQSILPTLGEPFADSSAIPVNILSQRTRKQVTVALSGDGADEIFAGYNKYQAEYMMRNGSSINTLATLLGPLFKQLPKNRNSFIGNKIRQADKLASALKLPAGERYWQLTSFRSEEEARALFSDHVTRNFNSELYNELKNAQMQKASSANFNNLLYADVHWVLPNDMLMKVDSMSMAHALEVRVPFLDQRLVEFAFGLPADFKIGRKMKKRVLQDAARPLLPEKLYKRPKHGFDVPLAKAYKGPLRSWVEDLTQADFIQEQGLFSAEAIKKLRHAVLNTSNFDQQALWSFFVFQDWYKRLAPEN